MKDSMYHVYEWDKKEKRWIPFYSTEDKDKALQIVDLMQNDKDKRRTKWKVVEMTTAVVYETE